MEAAIIRPKGGFGDVLMISVGIQILKRDYPDLDIDAFCPFPYAEPLYHLPQLRSIVEEIPRPEDSIQCSGYWRSFCYQEYDLVYEMLGPEVRYENGAMPDVKKHRIEMWTDYLGLEWKGETPTYHFSAVELKGSEWYWRVHGLPKPGGTKKLVGFQMRSANRKKDWDWKRFQELQQMLEREGVFVCLFGTDSSCQWRNDNTASFSRTTFRETASLMRFMDAMITVDSSLHHLACALGIPQIVLFGPSSCGMGDHVPDSPLFRHPHYPGCWVYSHSIHEDCVCWFDICNRHTGRQHLGSPCLSMISPRTIKNATMDLLNGALS